MSQVWDILECCNPHIECLAVGGSKLPFLTQRHCHLNNPLFLSAHCPCRLPPVFSYCSLFSRCQCRCSAIASINASVTMVVTGPRLVTIPRSIATNSPVVPVSPNCSPRDFATNPTPWPLAATALQCLNASPTNSTASGTCEIAFTLSAVPGT